MTNWAQTLSSGGRRIRYGITIESVGYGLSDAALAHDWSDGTGQVWLWTGLPLRIAEACVELPELATVHRPVLRGLPDPMAERPDLEGGVPAELGELAFEVVDSKEASYPKGWLTELLKLTAPAVAELSAAADAAVTTLSFTQTPPTETEAILFIGAEALRVVNYATGEVVRGFLGTDPQTHEAGDPVHAWTPFINRRIVRLYALPYAATTFAPELLEEYALDTAEFDETLGAWKLAARTRSKHLGRLAPIAQDIVTVRYVGPDFVDVDPVGDRTATDWQTWTGDQADANGEDFYVLNGAEVLTGRRRIAAEIQPRRRGCCGTKPEDFTAGKVLRRVFVAEADRAGDFRFSAAQATDRSNADWQKSAHWIDLLLSIMSSSSDPDDGLELVNFDPSYPNWSWMPPGYGLGLPAARIDFETFTAVKARTPEYLFPWFIYGRQPEPFGRLITREFLRPLGAYLITDRGQAKIVLPRLPWSGATAIELGADEILSREVGNLARLPDVEIKLSADRQAGWVRYRLGPDAIPMLITDRDFGGTMGGRGYYAHDDVPVDLEVPGVDPARAEFLALKAAGRLYRLHKPQLNARIAVDLQTGNQAISGSIVSVTLAGVPNLDGTRGWDGQRLEVGERELEPDRAAYRLAAFGTGVAADIRKIAPAGLITQVFETPSIIVTLATNRYTQPDAPDGLPTTDAAAFAVGDVVALYNLDGTLASTTTQEVTGRAGNDLDLDGNFGGALAVDLILAFADYTDCAAAQQTGWAFEASR